MSDIRKLVQEHKDLIIETRRDLHRIPELAYQEKKTAEYVTSYLRREKIEVQTGIAQTGVVGLLKGGADGKTLLLRADMDALPIKEETGLPFASAHEGIMHACGHDAHMAMALGAATILNGIKDRLSGNIKFVFQPAEEGEAGARAMIEAGVMENPKVDWSIGIHVWPAIAEGKIGVKDGLLLAAMDRFDLTILGKGGHAATPHLCVDALDVSAMVVSALQRVVSRQMNPFSPTVLSVCSLHAGTAFNAIPGEAKMSGTTRTFDRDVWDSWQERMERIVCGVCESMGAKYKLKYRRGYPPTINDHAMAELVRECAAASVGEENVVETSQAMTSDDISYFLDKSPGCFFQLGVGRGDEMNLHTCTFDFNENILLKGVETYCRAALSLLV